MNDIVDVLIPLATHHCIYPAETGIHLRIHTDVPGVILRGEIPREKLRTLVGDVDTMFVLSEGIHPLKTEFAEAFARKRRIRIGAKMAEARRIEANKLLLERWTAHYGTEPTREVVGKIYSELLEEAPDIEAQAVVASHAGDLRESFRQQVARNVMYELRRKAKPISSGAPGEPTGRFTTPAPTPLLRSTRGPLHALETLRGIEPEEQVRWLGHYGILSPERAAAVIDSGEEGVRAAVSQYLPELERRLGRQGPMAAWMRYQRRIALPETTPHPEIRLRAETEPVIDGVI